MTDSFIKLSRALLEWDWHNEPKTFCLYIHMLMMANHEETRWRGETLRRGQLLTGRKQLSTASGLTENEVRTALKNLQKTGDVVITTRNKYSIVTLAGYDAHCSIHQQDCQQSTSEIAAGSPAGLPADHQQGTSKAPADHQHITTSNNLDNLKSLRKAAEDAPAREGLVAYNTPDMAAIEDMWQRMGNKVTANDLFRFEQAIADGHSAQDILDAMKEADEHGARNSWAYVKKVLANWQQNGRTERKKDPRDMSVEELYGGYL